MNDNAIPADLLVLNESLQRIIDAVHHDPFEVLGRHEEDGLATLRLFLPRVEAAWVGELELQRIPESDFFVWHGEASLLPWRCEVRVQDRRGGARSFVDPYCFPPQISDFDLHLFGEGGHWHAYRWLGANICEVDGVSGTMFAVWAPNADRLSVVGDFNDWDGRMHPMRTRGGSGVWELFLPGVKEGAFYKFEIRGRDGAVRTKIDPYARWFQKRPETACVVTASSRFSWGDGKWMESRRNGDWQHAPMSIYEVHLGSWRRSADNGFLNYRELAHQLAEYVGALGFTHVELLPITEHPLDASWGYQTTGYFAPTSRFGAPEDFRYFVDYLHRQGIGVILDWVPAHFPKDDFALGRYDGTSLYEHEDPRLGEHRDWGTLIFNYGRAEVKNFLLSSAVYWLEEFHLDGLRVDAVASMLYLDYSRQPGEWLPNRFGGRENIEAMEFLRHLNHVTHDQFPGTLTIAEESTAWPMVSRPTWIGGLGFSMKWDMGWMHDTLDYFAKDPIHRHFHHDRLTFGMLYHFTENFVLPFSHDEVVHGKRSMLDKMPGDPWQRFASLRLLYSYLFTYPGKKLLFMGSEFGQGREWNEEGQLDWYLLERPQHPGVRDLVSELNRFYRERPALHDREFEHSGFEWVDCHDASQSVITYLRRGRDGGFSIVALNFTPVVRRSYRIGVPAAANYLERFNSDAAVYGGSNVSNPGNIKVESIPWMNYGQSVTLTLPPLGAIVIEPG